MLMLRQWKKIFSNSPLIFRERRLCVALPVILRENPNRFQTVVSPKYNKLFQSFSYHDDMVLGDFHLHSTFSDGKLSIPQIVDFYGERGFGAIAITDHISEEAHLIGKTARYLGKSLTRESFPIYIETIKAEAERAWAQYKMIVLPGMELTKIAIREKHSAHVVVVGAELYMSADAPVEELLKSVRSIGAISIAAHPVDTKKRERQTHYLWNHRDEFQDDFDAWEVASGPYLFDEVAQTKLPKIANSDLHAPSQMRSWKTLVDAELNPEAILEAIRKQRVDFKFYDYEHAPTRFLQKICEAPPLAFRESFLEF